MDPLNPPVAPSATPAAVPGIPAAASTPAPSATPPAPPTTLEQFAALAAKDLVGMVAGTPPEPAPGTESPPAPPAVTPSAAPTAVQTPGTAAPATPEPDDDPEIAPEEQAHWSDSEKRIYGALQKERAKRKEARSEVKETRAELATLKQQLDQVLSKLNTPPGAPAATPPATPDPAPSAAPAVPVPGVLADCLTLEAVDARAAQAASIEAQALRLQTTLVRQNGRETVEAQLKAAGVQTIEGVPLAEASEAQIGDFLATVYEGAAMTRVQAEPRKRFLVQQAATWEQATKEMPELQNPNSSRAAMFRTIVAQNPWIRTLGPNWPAVVVTQILGQEARSKTPAPTAPVTPAPSATPAAVVPTPPAARPLPGAPRVSGGALPKTNEYTAAAERVHAGTATLADVTLMAKAGMAAPAR